jgi:hypothetical protein
MATHPYVMVKSSLHLIGIYLDILRERFANPGDSFQWFYDEEDSLSRLFIEAGAGDEVKKNDARPALYVDRSPLVFPKVSIGDFVGSNRPTGLKAFYSTGTGQIIIDCVSKNRGESAVLGDIVQGFLMMSSDQILKHKTLRDITPITLGATQVWEKDARVYATRVTSEISFDVKWATTPVARKLQGVELRIDHANAVDYHELALSSLNRVDLDD